MAPENLIFLKVKIKSLAAEAKIIRFHERKANGGTALRSSLHGHRVHPVRHEARHALLVYAFLRGKKLSQVEQKSKTPPDKKRLKDLVKRFGSEWIGAWPSTMPPAQEEALEKWLTGN
jgi:hypothetical protein